MSDHRHSGQRRRQTIVVSRLGFRAMSEICSTPLQPSCHRQRLLEITPCVAKARFWRNVRHNFCSCLCACLLQFERVLHTKRHMPKLIACCFYDAECGNLNASDIGPGKKVSNCRFCYPNRVGIRASHKSSDQILRSSTTKGTFISRQSQQAGNVFGLVPRSGDSRR
jgi:hypothetical protein